MCDNSYLIFETGSLTLICFPDTNVIDNQRCAIKLVNAGCKSGVKIQSKILYSKLSPQIFIVLAFTGRRRTAKLFDICKRSSFQKVMFNCVYNIHPLSNTIVSRKSYGLTSFLWNWRNTPQIYTSFMLALTSQGFEVSRRSVSNKCSGITHHSAQSHYPLVRNKTY